VVIIDPKPEPKPNGRVRTFQLVRNYALLVLGIVLVLYGAAPPVDPAVFTFGGSILGLNPALRAQQA
jgi:hypothetical protein